MPLFFICDEIITLRDGCEDCTTEREKEKEREREGERSLRRERSLRLGGGSCTLWGGVVNFFLNILLAIYSWFITRIQVNLLMEVRYIGPFHIPFL
jgi:hypothetical protein